MFLHSFQLLLSHGVDPDLVNGKEIHVLTELLTAANRWLTHALLTLPSEEAHPTATKVGTSFNLTNLSPTFIILFLHTAI